MTSPTLDEIYASAPPDVVLLKTLEIDVPGIDNIYLCEGFEDVSAHLENGSVVTFRCGSLAIGRPERSDSTKQNLKFGVWNANGEVNKASKAMEAADEESMVYFREYVVGEYGGPKYGPLPATIEKIMIQGINATISASYRDILNTAYPRQRYTNLNAPGIRYL